MLSQVAVAALGGSDGQPFPRRGNKSAMIREEIGDESITAYMQEK